MVSKERDKGLGERRLSRALEHVNSFWFPVNREFHERLRAAVIEGKYDNDCISLTREIRGDFALFTYCLREVAARLRKEGVSISESRNAFDLLEQAGTQRLKEILSIETSALSPHSFNTITETQRVRLEEALVSASACESMCAGLGINAEIGYSTALLRQLGYALIAWNYSTVYQKTVFSLHPGESLDEALTKELGFSPVLLATTVVEEWGISPDVLSVIKGEDHYPGPLNDSDMEAAAIVKTMSRICKIGEALARANNPQLYPSAVRDWAFAFDEVQSILGRDGLGAIAARVETNSKNYVSTMPHIFKGGFVLDPQARISSGDLVASYEPNPFVEQCSEPLRTALTKLYRKMAEESSAHGHLRELVREIIPKSGFHRGCVYTADPSLGLLVPQLSIGACRTSDFTSIKYTADEEVYDTVLNAFHGSKVVVGAVNNDPNEPVTCLARALGYSQRIGILYLETPQMIFNVLEGNTRNEFNAIAYTMDDCFKLVT